MKVYKCLECDTYFPSIENHGCTGQMVQLETEAQKLNLLSAIRDILIELRNQ